MSKDRSITSQLVYALGQSQHLGESKRSYKMGHGGDTGERIYSLSYGDSLYKVARGFGEWMKANHPEIRQAKEIRQEHLQGYLDDHQDKWASSTCGRVISNLGKIEETVKKTYHRKTDWGAGRLRNPVERTETRRSLVASDKDYNRLMAVMHPSGGQMKGNAWKMLPLSRFAGLRLNEAAEVKFGRLTTTGGHWGYGTLTLHGKEDGTKGGRWRTIDIQSAEASQKLSKALKGVLPGCPVIGKIGQPQEGLKEASVSRQLHRGILRAGLDPETWKWNSAHPFRKLFSQECYDLARSTGLSRTAAADYAHDQLGHGDDRRQLDKVYIGRMW